MAHTVKIGNNPNRYSPKTQFGKTLFLSYREKSALPRETAEVLRGKPFFPDSAQCNRMRIRNILASL